MSTGRVLTTLKAPDERAEATLPQFVFDFDAVKALLGDDRSFALEILGDFLKEADEDVGKIAAVLEATPANMQTSLQQHAHRVKGAAGNLGLKELQETCALLEHNAKEGVWSAQMLPEIREVFAALQAYVDKVRQGREDQLSRQL